MTRSKSYNVITKLNLHQSAFSADFFNKTQTPSPRACSQANLSLQGRLRRCFVTERKRQWKVREALKVTNHKLAFVTSDNPAASGRFMKENFNAKDHDATTIKNNIDDLSKLKVKIEAVREFSDKYIVPKSTLSPKSLWQSMLSTLPR